MDTQPDSRRQYVGIGGGLLVAGAGALGVIGAAILIPFGLAAIVYGVWPGIQRHKPLRSIIERGFVPALLAVPFIAVLPIPDSLPYKIVDAIGLGVFGLSSAVVLLHYLAKGSTQAVISKEEIGAMHLAALRARGGPPEQTELSEPELGRIDHIRVLWGASLSDATKYLMVLMIDLREGIPIQCAFAHLLRYPQAELEVAVGGLASALLEHSHVPLAEVRNRFDKFSETYMRVVRWVHAFETLDPNILKGTKHGEGYMRWWRQHEQAREELFKLTKRAGLSDFEWPLEHHFDAGLRHPPDMLAPHGNRR